MKIINFISFQNNNYLKKIQPNQKQYFLSFLNKYFYKIKKNI